MRRPLNLSVAESVPLLYAPAIDCPTSDPSLHLAHPYPINLVSTQTRLAKHNRRQVSELYEGGRAGSTWASSKRARPGLCRWSALRLLGFGTFVVFEDLPGYANDHDEECNSCTQAGLRGRFNPRYPQGSTSESAKAHTTVYPYRLAAGTRLGLVVIS